MLPVLSVTEHGGEFADISPYEGDHLPTLDCIAVAVQGLLQTSVVLRAIDESFDKGEAPGETRLRSYSNRLAIYVVKNWSRPPAHAHHYPPEALSKAIEPGNICLDAKVLSTLSTDYNAKLI